MFGLRSKQRTVIIGLDGVPYGAIKKFAEDGIMKNVKKIIDKGTFKKMSSSIPEISSVAWSSVITGKNPAEHGIFGFTDLQDDSYQIGFPNFNDLKSNAFWLNGDNKKHVIVNVPATYPVKPLNGIHVSGFVSIQFEKSVYPQSLIPKLKQLNYKIDVDAQLAHKSIDLFLEDLDITLNNRIKTLRFLWDSIKWNTFMFVFTGTDRLGHFVWDAYEDENHKYYQEFINHFKKIDDAIGDVLQRLNKNDLLVMLSDHGFEKLDENVNINHLLKEKSYLEIEKGKQQKLINLDSSSKAFALDPARIYINEKGKYPNGSVEKEEKAKIIDELKVIFGSLEREGRKVIRDIYEKEEIYKGPYMEKAPDIVLVGNKGFDLKAKVDTDRLYEKNIFKGKHSQDDAFFIANRRCDSLIPDNLSVYKFLDTLGTIKKNI